MKLLEGKCVLVTGAGSGIGRGIARRCAEEGAAVALGYFGSPEGVEETRKLLPSNAQTMLIEADIRSRGAVGSMIEKVVHAWGQLDIMVCNAGLYLDGKFVEFSVENLNALLETNVVGTWNCAQAASQHMIHARRQGHIILISSTQASRAPKGCSAYALTKAALKSLARSMAHELAEHNIRVNVVSPGAANAAGNIPLMQDEEYRTRVENEIPLRRVADPLEIGDGVVYLSSNAAGYITGTDLVIDGGLLLNGPQV